MLNLNDPALAARVAELEAEGLDHSDAIAAAMADDAADDAPAAARYSVLPTMADFAVMDRDTDDGIPTLRFWSKVEADYAASLLNAGVERDDVEAAVQRATCATCGALAFAGTIDAAGRCEECQP